ncbi:MAG TPA: MMPL family transporter [Marinagarivorans sp.]
MEQHFIRRYAEFIIQFRWWVLLASTALVFAAATGAKNLAFTDDYRAFFAKENPQLAAFEAMQNTYDKSDNVLFVLTPKDGNVFTPQTLASIQWLTEQAWQTPYSSRVDSITNYQYTEAIEDDLNVADLVADASALSAAELSAIKQIAVNEPLLAQRLIDATGRVTGINVTLQLPGEKLTEVPEAAAFVRDLAKQLEARDNNLEVRLSGIVMMNAAFAEAAQSDMTTLVPLMFLVVIVVLGVLLRSVSATFSTVMLIVLSIAGAMGIFGWSGLKLTPPTASAPTIILTMAVADAVHLLVTFLWGMRSGGLTKPQALVESLRVNMMPIFLTSITTALGFLSMNFSEVPPLAHLGNIVALGVSLAFVLSITFLPALVAVLPFNIKPQPVSAHYSSGLGKFGALVIHRRKPLLWGMLAISIGFTAFVPKNEINDEFVNYFDKSVPFRVDTDYASEHLVSPYTVEYAFKAGEPGGIAEPAYLAKVDEFVSYLKSYPEVSHVFTLTDTLKRLNQNMHGDDPAYYRLPESRELAAQYLLLYEMSLPYGLDLNNQINVDKSATRVTMSTVSMGSSQVLAMEQAINDWLATHAADYEVEAASPNLMFAHIGMRNAQSLLGGTTLALIAISFILIVALRSLKIGLISLVPNLIPAGIAFGIWGLVNGQVGMSVSVVAGMTLGIVVDDTVHFLSKYLRARREKGYSAQEACLYAFTHVGRALVVTTVVLVAGFMVLAMSSFKLNADMGIVTAMTIAIALAVDFLLLPPLLMALDKRHYRASAHTGASTTANTQTPIAAAQSPAA